MVFQGGGGTFSQFSRAVLLAFNYNRAIKMIRTERRVNGWLRVFSSIPDNLYLNIHGLFDLPNSYCQPGNPLYPIGLKFIECSR